MSKKILITGAEGQLGRLLQKIFHGKFDVIPTTRNCNKLKYVQNINILDITAREEVKQLIHKFKPDVIINCAAYTGVDESEKNKIQAHNVNVMGLHNLLYSSNKNTYFIHISSDYVFDGKSGPYSEDDSTYPINHYGKTKLESENILRSSNRTFIIIRPSVVFSNSHNNFYTWVYNSLKNNQKIMVVTDQISNPTWTWSLSEAIYKLILNNVEGIFHYAGNEVISRYDFALKVASKFYFDEKNITAIKTEDLNQLANRPLVTTLNCSKIKNILNIEHPNIDNILSIFKKDNNE